MSDVRIEEDAPVEGVLLEVETFEAPELRTVEAWQSKHTVVEWLHKGACVSQRWALGREVTEAEYLTALESFAGRPVGRE